MFRTAYTKILQSLSRADSAWLENDGGSFHGTGKDEYRMLRVTQAKKGGDHLRSSRRSYPSKHPHSHCHCLVANRLPGSPSLDVCLFVPVGRTTALFPILPIPTRIATSKFNEDSPRFQGPGGTLELLELCRDGGLQGDVARCRASSQAATDAFCCFSSSRFCRIFSCGALHGAATLRARPDHEKQPRTQAQTLGVPKLKPEGTRTRSILWPLDDAVAD